MHWSLTENHISTLVGTLLGGTIAITAQTVFYILGEKRRIKEARLSLAKQRLDEFYSPMMTRLLEIEYKLWIDHELKQAVEAKPASKEKVEAWDRELAEEIELIDGEIIDIFRHKRWLAFDSTVVECQKLIRYLESKKLTGVVSNAEIAAEWGDVTRLKELHTDVRQHHIKLMETLGMRNSCSLPILPAEAGGFQVHGELALDKYQESLQKRIDTTK